MSKNFYTLLILPKKHSSAKKVSLSSTLVKGVSVAMMIMILTLMYFAYDYIHIRRDQQELRRLRKQTVEQRKEIENLAAKVERFSQNLEELRQFDRKIRIMANLETRKDKEQLLGIGGPSGEEGRLKEKMKADDKALIEGINRELERLEGDAQLRQESFEALLGFLKERRSLLAATPSLWPVTGWVTSEFGRRRNPFGGDLEFHKGIDIATKYGKAVVSPADGVVTDVSTHDDIGRAIQIDHGHGISTLYAHLSKAVVRPGMTVRKGERIGYVGNSGRSTGSHLHYSVMINGVAVNPRKYLN